MGAKTRGNHIVVPINMDAAFFHERALKWLNKYNYDKALKYFHRTVELEPDEAVHYCNLAGVMAEIGRYEESNNILQYVLEYVNGQIYECYFYLASNYANMDQWEQSEEYALRYLEKEPFGPYAEEAEDLLYFLSMELQRPPKECSDHADDPVSANHDQARKLLEDGRFLEASKLLNEIIKENPEFLAARNNLSLCYYYMDRFEKAMEMAESVLQKENGNLYALCNLAIFYFHSKDDENLQPLLNFLGKIYPIQYDHYYKLATTLGILGQHEAAYRLFKKMNKMFGEMDIYLFHYCAVASYNIGKLEEAERLWKKVSRLDPGSPVSLFYLKEVKEMKEGRREWKELPYHYHLAHIES